MVMIDMNNPNTLVALAYIKTNDNPLHVFCNYILYLLINALNQTLRADELQNQLKENFGLDMPYNLIKSCTNILKRKNEIKILERGAGYSIEETKFDACEFNHTMNRLRNQELQVLVSIKDFVQSKYNIEWNIEETKKFLSHFLDCDENAARLFLNKETNVDNRKVSPSWYIGRYVTYVRSLNDSPEKAFLEEIINGMMIYQGVYQTNNYQQDKDRKYKGTVFYLDTKIFLRAMGFSWQEHVLAAQELIKLIKDECGGIIGIFRQTLNEIQNALYNAGRQLKNKQRIDDIEIKVFSELNPSEATLLTEYSEAALRLLERDYDVKLFEENIDWNSKINHYNTINLSEIVDYIQQEHENWKAAAIQYDVEIINIINILRKGNYDIDYGGKNKLPIFVTSNTELVRTFKEFVKNDSANNESCYNWKPSHMPIISDNMLLSRLWLPRAKKYADIPALTLAQYAYAAQMPNSQYFVKLREVAELYKNNNNIDLLNIDEERKVQLEDIFVKQSKGSLDNLTEELVAASAEEFAKIQNISFINEISELKTTVTDKEEIIKNKDFQINKLNAEKFVNKIGLGRFLILAAKGWWIIATIITSGILLGIDIGLSDITIPTYLTVIIPAVVELFLTLIDKFSDKKDLQNFLVKKAVAHVWKKYAKSIKVSLSQKSDIDIDWIINYCLENTTLFNKYKRFCAYR